MSRGPIDISGLSQEEARKRLEVLDRGPWGLPLGPGERRVIAVRRGAVGNVTLISVLPTSQERPQRTSEENPKKESAARRGRPADRDVLQKHFQTYTRRDGAKVRRVIGRDVVRAMRCKYFDAAMQGKTGAPKK